jgi:hypothetical protein
MEPLVQTLGPRILALLFVLAQMWTSCAVGPVLCVPVPHGGPTEERAHQGCGGGASLVHVHGHEHGHGATEAPARSAAHEACCCCVHIPLGAPPMRHDVRSAPADSMRLPVVLAPAPVALPVAIAPTFAPARWTADRLLLSQAVSLSSTRLLI